MPLPQCRLLISGRRNRLRVSHRLVKLLPSMSLVGEPYGLPREGQALAYQRPQRFRARNLREQHANLNQGRARQGTSACRGLKPRYSSARYTPRTVPYLAKRRNCPAAWATPLAPVERKPRRKGHQGRCLRPKNVTRPKSAARVAKPLLCRSHGGGLVPGILYVGFLAGFTQEID